MYDVGSSFTKDIFMKRLTAVLAVMLSAGVHAGDVNPYIINGSPTTDSELSGNYPTFTSLYFHDGSKFGNYCGGTIIDAQHVLTAAHCIYRDYEAMLHTWVVSGLADQTKYNNGGYQSARVEKIYYQSSYSPNLDPSKGLVLPDDIAILKLERPLSIGNYSSYLNTTTNDVYANTRGADTFKAIGRGYTNHVANDKGQTVTRTTTNVVMQTSLTFASSGICSSTSKQLCFDGPLSGSYKNSTCNGDSGGPVYWYDGFKYQQIGITSYGPGTCGDQDRPYTSVFTEVYDYANWINNVVNGAVDPTFEVRKSSGVRSLFNFSTGWVMRSSSALSDETSMPKISSTSSIGSSGSSGGSLGLFSVLLLGALSLRKKIRR